MLVRFCLAGLSSRTTVSFLLPCVLTFATVSLTFAGTEDTVRSPMGYDGKRLYENYCAGCHHPLEKTDKPRRGALRIKSAIEHIPAMAELDHLSDEQCRAIALALRLEQPQEQQGGEQEPERKPEQGQGQR